MGSTPTDPYFSRLQKPVQTYIYGLIDNPNESSIIIGYEGIARFISRYSQMLNNINIDLLNAVGKHIKDVARMPICMKS
jgi:hypothetical protein